ncbi:MAG: hypothetical protein M3094_04855 [Actinomycetia bacterium]|nr:hypothetical protein [Actinomycetes bacterium]
MNVRDATDRGTRSDGDVLTFRRPSPRALLTALIVVIVVLVALDVASIGASGESGERLAINSPSSVAAWWASFELLFLSVLLLLAALARSRSGQRAVALTLGVGAGIALFWSLDKIADFKETIIGLLPSRDVLSSLDTAPSATFYIAAVIAVAVLILALSGIAVLARTDPTTVLAVATGAAMNLFGGATVAGVVTSESVARIAAEEAIEFLGVAIMVWAVYRMIDTIEIRIQRP